MKKQTKTVQIPNTKVDWDEIKTEVTVLQEALTHKAAMTNEEKRAILKTRAQSLAVETKDNSALQEFIEIIEFSLASEIYGIESRFVREVYPMKDFTILPGVPAFVLGIINVRGQILSVIDLKKFFNLPEKGLGELNKVIIIKNEKMEFGILADVIKGTSSVPKDSIQTSLPNINGIGAEYLKGVTNEHLIILDAKNILADENIIVNQETENNL
jgi:purine-binding chemotaxis protein CheW